MKVAILTMFNGLSSTYSLVNVVKEQITMLLNNNIEVKLLVSESCLESERYGIFKDPRLEYIKIINSYNGINFKWYTYTSSEDIIHDSFYFESKLIANDYIKYLSDVDVCIMHDILYQGIHLVHNIAIRDASAVLNNIRFIEFTHSAPASHIDAKYPISAMYSDMDNTIFVYPTKCGLEALSKQYNISIDKCYCINNSIDILSNMNECTKHICNTLNIYNKDILIVYPARLNIAKGFHEIIELASYIQLYNYTVGIIFCDFPSSDIDPNMYKFMCYEIAHKFNINKDNIIFTTNIGYPNGISRESVYELYTLSNLYICPSYSESFGLGVIEAASRGNYIVLNEAVPALKEVGDILNAYYMRWNAKNFKYDTVETYLPSKELYYKDNIRVILNNMFNN
ncbi:MAG: glycosyltransferase, partial [Erysipelotrichaceae bacterium]